MRTCHACVGAVSMVFAVYAAFAADVLDIGSRRELFVDGFLVDAFGYCPGTHQTSHTF